MADIIKDIRLGSRKVKIFALGDKVIWERPLAKLEGKFYNFANASEYRYYANSDSGKRVDISSYVDPDTKEFAIDDIAVTPWLSSSVERIDNIGNYGAVTDMSFMFRNSLVESINLSNLDTSNVTCMGAMFYYCSILRSLDLSHFNTNNVSDTYRMFSGCSNIFSLILSGFDMINAQNMNHMFELCTSLTTVIGPINGIGKSFGKICNGLSLSDCPLTAASAMVFINGLATVTSTKTLTLKASTYSQLTAEQIAVATSKGWTVASA